MMVPIFPTLGPAAERLQRDRFIKNVALFALDAAFSGEVGFRAILHNSSASWREGVSGHYNGRGVKVRWT